MAPKTKKRPSKRPIKTSVEGAQGHWQDFLRNVAKRKTRYIFLDNKTNNIVAAMISEDSYDSLLALEETSRKVVEECMLLPAEKLKEWLDVDRTPTKIKYDIAQDTLQDIVNIVHKEHKRCRIVKSSVPLTVMIIDEHAYKSLCTYEKLIMKLAEFHARRQL